MNVQTLELKQATEDYFQRNYQGKPLLAEPPDPALVVALNSTGFAPYSLRVLEIGCGAGRNLSWLTRQFDCDCVGVEPSEQVVAKLGAEMSQVEFRAGWSYDLPCESNSFDLVLIYGVLSVVERDQLLQSIGEALRVAKRWLMIGEYVALEPFRMAYHHADSFCYHTDFEPIVMSTGAVACRFSQTVVHEGPATERRVSVVDPRDTTCDRDRFKTCLFEKCLSSTPLKTFDDFAVS